MLVVKLRRSDRQEILETAPECVLVILPPTLAAPARTVISLLLDRR
jgi:hypothetical protein